MNIALKDDKYLAKDVNEALRQLVHLSQQLIRFTDDEARSLSTQDHMGFALAQREKDRLSERYVRACREFQTRLEEFRGADKGLIVKLDQTQNTLRKKTQDNNEKIALIRDRTQVNTQATLFTAQEMGQRLAINTDIREVRG